MLGLAILFCLAVSASMAAVWLCPPAVAALSFRILLVLTALAAALLPAGCSAIGALEGVAQERAKQPIIVTVYHTKF